jgi:hypothetical protein
MACVVEITTWLRGNSKDDKTASVLQKKKVRLEGKPENQSSVTRSVKLAANICGVHTRNKFKDGVYYLLTAKSKATFVSYRFLEGDEAVRDVGFFAHEWREGVRGYRNNQ